MRRLLLVVATASVILAAYSGTGRISADTAATNAVTAIGGDSRTRVVVTRLSTFGAEAPSSAVASPGTAVWAVSLAGLLQTPSCGPYTATPHPCPSPLTTALVLIDATTGSFVMAEMPDPGASPVP